MSLNWDEFVYPKNELWNSKYSTLHLSSQVTGLVLVLGQYLMMVRNCFLTYDFVEIIVQRRVKVDTRIF